jgi:hypothetical protein
MGQCPWYTPRHRNTAYKHTFSFFRVETVLFANTMLAVCRAAAAVTVLVTILTADAL